MKRETDLFKIEESDLGKEIHFKADIISGPFVDEDGKTYGFFQRISRDQTKGEMTDTERLDWLEEVGACRLMVSVFTEKTLYSVDEGTTWHETVREAVDTAMDKSDEDSG